MMPLWLVTGKANHGYCPICEKRTFFVRYHEWLRDNYRCMYCWSIPRQRAIVKYLSDNISDWSDLKIHESSPDGCASDYIANRASEYVGSHFYSDVSPGCFRDGFRSENLEAQTFADQEFDLVITQDVMEHVLDPARAFQEIERTLKPGGMHVFTVPVYGHEETRIRARHGQDGEIEYLAEPDYHGNPIDASGSLVTREWGRDIAEFIEDACGLKTELLPYNDVKFGLVAEFLEVLVTKKPEAR